ncbi:hypothetical protein BA022_08425 [Diaphorobacter nitroreducens]|uniref:hypothetical protein n=1 Tax=Diaphorobacter nitroreducens TaxID=164759 RepID=UPI000B59A166|nr:hypothetical protein [Diaphorobacter nitroreducens]ASI68579.1 hypothetical protein BA022_08425 [Diaphorobacter nitroreducens]
MLGWWIVTSTQTPEERDRADQDTRRATLLVNWEASVNEWYVDERFMKAISSVLQHRCVFGWNHL